MSDTPTPGQSTGAPASHHAPEAQDPAVRQAAQCLADIVARSGQKDTGQLWKQVQTALRKAPVDQMRIARIVAERNTDALAKIVGDLAAGRTQDTLPKPEPRGGPAGGPSTGIAAAAAAGAGAAADARPRHSPPRTVPSPQELKAALAAFRKRLKLTRLDHESRLGANRPTTGGRKFDEMAILPPNQYPRAVWDELARQGKIRDTGGGFFTIVEKAGPVKDAKADKTAEPASEPESEPAPQADAADAPDQDGTPNE